MNARKAEREAADQRMREERLQAQLKAQSALVRPRPLHSLDRDDDLELTHLSTRSQSGEKLDAAVRDLSAMFPDADPDFLRTLITTQEPPHLENAANQLLSTSQYPKRRQAVQPPGPSSSSSPHSVSAAAQQQPSGGFLSGLRRQLKGESSRSGWPLPPPPSLTPPASSPRPGAVSQRPPGMSPQPHRPEAMPTSTDAIRANLTRAIQVRRRPPRCALTPCCSSRSPSPFPRAGFSPRVGVKRLERRRADRGQGERGVLRLDGGRKPVVRRRRRRPAFLRQPRRTRSVRPPLACPSI